MRLTISFPVRNKRSKHFFKLNLTIKFRIVQTSTGNEGAQAKITAPTRNTAAFMMIAIRLPIKSMINPEERKHKQCIFNLT